ncbi:MAG: hypothetical protein QXI58_05895 [Candidatus Micrarchaeia archaeon]
MNEKEINEILKNLDILKIVGSKLRDELKVFSNYMIGYGIYIIICSILSFFGYSLAWFYLLTFAFFLSHSLNIGIFRSLMIWLPISAMVYIPTFYTNNLFLVYLIFFIGIFGGIFIWAKLSNFKEKYPKIISQIGIAWGYIYFGLFWMILYLNALDSKIISILNFYALSIALFISGIIHYVFFIISIVVLIFGIPMYSFNPKLAILIYAFIGIFMTIFGILNKR